VQNTKFICTSFGNNKLFWSVSQWVQVNCIFGVNFYLSCVSCNDKNYKTTAKFPEKSRISAETNVILFVFKHVLCTYNITVSFTQHESGTRKDIFWSVTVCNKNLFSQCNSNRMSSKVQVTILWLTIVNLKLYNIWSHKIWLASWLGIGSDTRKCKHLFLHEYIYIYKKK
jgi:hypothetical protein